MDRRAACAELLDLFARRVHGISPEFTGKVTGTLGAIAAWAFGASRALDYLTQDTRVQCCYANDSDCTGAALSREKKGKAFADLIGLAAIIKIQ